jgi:integrase/recombinase XerD
MTWEEAVDAFLFEGRRSNLSASTLTNYRAYLAGPRVVEFRKDYGVASPADMTAEKLKRFEVELQDAGLAPGTVVTFHRVLKNFASFCIRNGYAQDRQILEVRAPKQPKEEPDSFTMDEEKRLLAAAKTPRDRMILDFMLRTGLRLAEVCNITLDDIVDAPGGAYVRVRQGKGRKDRVVPLDTPGHKVSSKLRQYIARERPRETDSHNLFLSTRRAGRRGHYTPITTHGLQVLIRRLGEETGIQAHPHKFRHTFATRSLSAGVDVMALQRALGHTTLAMVSRYVHYQKDDLLNAWKARRD